LNQINAIYDHDGGQALQTSFEEVYPEREAARFLQARTSLMRNNQNEVTGAITVLRDETCGRELDRVKGEFMSFAAHELRTPLTSIIGYLEFCLHPEDFGGFSAGQQHEFLVEINNKAELLAKLVSDLLDISRIEAGKPLPLDVRTIDIKRLVGKIVEQYGLHAPRHRFDIRFEEGFPGVLRADEDRLGQVLENLLSNAVKYAPEGSLVQILGGVDGGVCRVSVEDQGIGMTAEQVARIFDKFYRADSSNTAARGLGLGMSIARQIVERHGGHIEVESEKGRGTRVIFTVPTEPGGSNPA
jgi:signal transduction histidine kinase